MPPVARRYFPRRVAHSAIQPAKGEGNSPSEVAKSGDTYEYTLHNVRGHYSLLLSP